MLTNIEDIVKGLGKHFQSLGLDFFIIGATARDIISDEAKLKISPRKTADVDFGLLMDSWERLADMRDLFSKDSDIKLSEDEDNKVRYYYKGTPFDLVPFGGVEKKGRVSWPPFYDTLMTVTGYHEALNTAKEISVGGATVKVVTPEMLVALKVVSWDEKQSRKKDAEDINYIISNYEQIDVDIHECLLDNHEGILEYFDHDSYPASIALMGLRISKFANDDHVGLILKVLGDSQKFEKLSRAMDSSIVNNSENNEQNEKKLLALLYGLNFDSN